MSEGLLEERIKKFYKPNDYNKIIGKFDFIASVVVWGMEMKLGPVVYCPLQVGLKKKGKINTSCYF